MRDFRSVQILDGWRQRLREIATLLAWSVWLAISGFTLIYAYFVEFELGQGCVGYVKTSETINPVQASRICTYFVPYASVLFFWIMSAVSFWTFVRR